MYSIEESTCNIVWIFWRPRSHSVLPVVIRLPQNYAPLVPTHYTPRPWNCRLVFVRFSKKWNNCCGKRRHRLWIFNPNSTTGCLKYSFDTASASMNTIHLLCYVAGVRTAAFVTVYAQISFLVFFMFSFLVVPKDVLKTENVDKR